MRISTLIQLNYLSMEAEPEVTAEQTATEPNKTHKKGEPREKRPRPERKNEYEYNPDIIDESTVIPPLPKKGELIAKPDIKVYKEREVKSNLKIEELIEKKKAIRAEKFKFNRRGGENGENKHSTFKDEISEAQQLREKFNELKGDRADLREQLHKAIEEAKANNEKIKEYRTALKGSRENYSERLEDLEHRLISADISKAEEKSLNDEIMLLKRKLREAESSGNIEMKLEQCEERKEELDVEITKVKALKDPIENEYTRIRTELDKRNENITGLKTQLDAEKSEKTEEKERHDKEYEAWKEDKKKRLDKLEADIVKIREDNKKIWEEYHKKQDDFWKQKQLIDFLEWQGRVKARKVNDKEREARKAEYEKRDLERDREDQLKKYLGEIELINFLITYLNNLRADSNKVEEKKEVVVNTADVAAKLAADAQWKKERGVQIIVSKKSKEDEEPEKKHKKQKKGKNQTKQQQKFAIPFNVQTMFESLKLLAPATPEEIDAKIKELKDREQLFERASKEDSNEEDKKLAEEIKNKGGKREGAKKSKKQEEDDFPSI